MSPSSRQAQKSKCPQCLSAGTALGNAVGANWEIPTIGGDQFGESSS